MAIQFGTVSYMGLEGMRFILTSPSWLATNFNLICPHVGIEYYPFVSSNALSFFNTLYAGNAAWLSTALTAPIYTTIQEHYFPFTSPFALSTFAEPIAVLSANTSHPCDFTTHSFYDLTAIVYTATFSPYTLPIFEGSLPVLFSSYSAPRHAYTISYNLLSTSMNFPFEFFNSLSVFGEPIATFARNAGNINYPITGGNKLCVSSQLPFFSSHSLSLYSGPPKVHFHPHPSRYNFPHLSWYRIAQGDTLSYINPHSIALVDLKTDLISPTPLPSNALLFSRYRSDSPYNYPTTSPLIISDSYNYSTTSPYDLSAGEIIITQVHGNELYEPQPVVSLIQSDTVHVWIDGYLVDKHLIQFNITQRRDNVIDDFEAELDSSLYNMCDPRNQWGSPRIRVQINTTYFEFLLESRERASEESYSFTVWGRHPAALLTEPFSTEISEVFTHTQASTVASYLAGQVPLEWNCPDYDIPVYTANGLPLDLIRELADAIGGVVRTRHNPYRIVVEPLFPTRPKDLPTQTPVIHLDRYNNMLGCELNEELPQFNAVLVLGAVTGAGEVTLSHEGDTCLDITNTTTSFRVYKSSSNDTYSLVTTSPDATLIPGLSNALETITETLEVINGQASLQHFPQHIVSHQWIDTPYPSSVTPTFVGTQVVCPDVLAGTLSVTYTTLYDEWFVQFDPSASPDQQCIVALLTESSERNVLLEVHADPNSTIWGPDINSDLIFSEHQALLCAQASLDANYYFKRKFIIDTPYLSLQDGHVVSVADDFWSYSGMGIVWQADIIMNLNDDVPVATQSLEVHCYDKPS